MTFLDLNQDILVFPYKEFDIHIERSKLEKDVANVYITFINSDILTSVPCLKTKNSIIKKNVPFIEIPNLIKNIEKELDDKKN